MGKATAFIKKVLYVVGANAISLIVSLLTTLVLPKFFGDAVEQYGYYQIYIFYVGYIGFFHLGLCDGIYLRDAGKRYESLDKALYSSQFWILVAFESVVAIAFAAFGIWGITEKSYGFIWLMIAANLVVVLPRTMIQYYLQTTNRIKEYSVITTLERALYGVLLVAVLFTAFSDYRLVVIADILTKVIALFVAVHYCKDIVFAKPCGIKQGISECKTNIEAGAKLLFANISSILITGIMRWGIQQNWDVATYGKISFTLSVSNFILTFISAVGIVLYPTLRQASFVKLPGLYQTIRNVLMIPLLGCLVLYYPIEQVLSVWLPQYADSIRYMAILFPLCVYASKMTMLIQTYMNVYRMEKTMLKVNCSGVVVAVLTTTISVFILNNLTLAMVSIVINQMFRCICAELVLSKKLEISVRKDVALEAILAVVFILCNWYIGSWYGLGIYFAIYVVYCIVEKKKIVDIYQFLRRLLSTKQS